MQITLISWSKVGFLGVDIGYWYQRSWHSYWSKYTLYWSKYTPILKHPERKASQYWHFVLRNRSIPMSLKKLWYQRYFLRIWLLQCRRFFHINVQKHIQISPFLASISKVPRYWTPWILTFWSILAGLASAGQLLQAAVWSLWYWIVMDTDCSEDSFTPRGGRVGTQHQRKRGWAHPRAWPGEPAPRRVGGGGGSAEAPPRSSWFHTGHYATIHLQNSTHSVLRIQSIYKHPRACGIRR